MDLKTPSSGPNDPLPPGIEGDSLWIAPANPADYPKGKMPPSVLVLTKDEEINIEDCLDTLTFSDDIVVLDSFSSDRTCELAKKYPNVRLIKRKFDTWSKHSNWALENIHFKHQWVYYSDADERVPSVLRDEIIQRTNDPDEPHPAYRLRYQNMFFGRWIRRGGLYPVWIIRLFKHDHIRYEDREVNAHPVVRGVLGDFENNFIHYSFNKGLLPWFNKHNSYSDMESNEAIRIISAESASQKIKKLWSRKPGVGRRALKDLSFFMPMRGFLRFVYMYFFRLGFLDGLPGLHYALIISMYEYWIEVKIRERRSRWADQNEKTVQQLLAEPAIAPTQTEQDYPKGSNGGPLVEIMIPTFNEASHIREAVENAKKLGPVFVLDSFSTDGTQDIARQAGATVIENKFENYSSQKNWGLENLPFKGEWVFILDADERITPSLRDEIQRVVASPKDNVGYFVNRIVIFMGRRIRHGGLFPSWNLRLFKRGACRYEDRSVHEHMIADGPVAYVNHLMLHIRRESITQYIAKHIRYADMESSEWLKARMGQGGGAKAKHLFRDVLRWRQWLRRTVWPSLPLKPVIRFVYMYFFRLGFLDGVPGWHLACLMSNYEHMIALLYKYKIQKSQPKPGRRAITP